MTPNLNLLQASALQSLTAARVSQPIYTAADSSYRQDSASSPEQSPAPGAEDFWQSRPQPSAPAQKRSDCEGFTADTKFDLLSAYLDDEISEEERRQVEQWLSFDVQIQQQYQAQKKIRRALRAERHFYRLLEINRRQGTVGS